MELYTFKTHSGMKQITFTLVAIASAFIFLSNSIGRGRAAGPATTSPGETGQFCGSFGCHFSGAFDPEVRILFFDDQGNETSEYLPGEEYSVTVKIDHIGQPVGYGFQMVSLKSDDDTAINNFTDLPNQIHDVILFGRQYVEHSNRLGSDSIPVKWIAPDMGSGDITFYAAANAVNGNGSSSGDGSDTVQITIKEGMTSSLDFLNESSVELFPNPVQDYLNIKSETLPDELIVYNQSGQIMLKSYASNQLDLSHLNSGVYILHLLKDDSRIVKQLVKI